MQTTEKKDTTSLNILNSEMVKGAMMKCIQSLHDCGMIDDELKLIHVMQLFSPILETTNTIILQSQLRYPPIKKNNGKYGDYVSFILSMGNCYGTKQMTVVCSGDLMALALSLKMGDTIKVVGKFTLEQEKKRQLPVASWAGEKITNQLVIEVSAMEFISNAPLKRMSQYA